MDITGTSRLKKRLKEVINQDKIAVENYLYEKIQEYRQLFGHGILDYKQVLQELNIKLTTNKQNLFSVYNLVELDKTKKAIFVNEKIQEEYRKFYIMYEIAFILLLDYTKKYLETSSIEHININILPKIVFKSTQEQVVEELCSNFAFESLIPIELLKIFIENNESPKEIAEYFCLSEDIIKKYLEQKTLLPSEIKYNPSLTRILKKLPLKQKHKQIV